MNVSLYIPCYNAGKYLERCLKSVLVQTYPIQTILVVDDGSTDNTKNIVAQFPQVNLIQHPANRGLAAARNTAWQNLDSEYIANLDADCVAEPNWLAQLMKHFTASDSDGLRQMQPDTTKLAGVGGKLVESNQKGVANRWRVAHMLQHWGDERIQNPKWIYGSNSVYRRSALVAANGYKENYRTNYEDLDLSRRLYEQGYTLLYDPAAKVNHLRNDSIRSILYTRWRWTAVDLEPPITVWKLFRNIGRNIGRSFAYIYRDIKKSGISLLLIIDIALGIYSSYSDIRCYLNKCQMPKSQC
ncbi:MAG: glycosyltransferase family A protein [bacterium]|nr:glycosyltransferase family A protein [bacterium]